VSVRIRIELAGEPVPKARPRFGKGRVFTDARTSSYEASLGWAARVAMAGRAPLLGPLVLSVMAFLGIPRSWSARDRRRALVGAVQPIGKPDWDNVGKISDALNGIVWGDDAQVVDARVVKRYAEQPRLVLEIAPIEEV